MSTHTPGTVRVTVTVPEPVAKAAEALAREAGVSVSSFYADAVEVRVRETRRCLAAERISSMLRRESAAPDAAEELRRERRATDRELD